ncbi:MAG: hypothetical protein JKY93_11495, partial [Gammaproteobacteria bacterium]|nr:hypothetical protein [Gammaproteobacteria bacterium]
MKLTKWLIHLLPILVVLTACTDSQNNTGFSHDKVKFIAQWGSKGTGDGQFLYI